MNKHGIIKICFPVIFFLLLTNLVPAKEPEYQGKTLSEWLVVEDREARQEAIRQIGTNAIPTLIDLLGVTDENRWQVLRKLESQELRKGNRAGSVFNSVLSKMALDGFGILGTNAVPAIPQIVKLFGKVDTCSEAAQALALLGPDGVAALTNGLSSQNVTIRGITIWAIGEKAALDSNTVMRIMLKCLKDPGANLRADAARFLAHKDPTVVIPALVPMLDDNAADVVDKAARSLASYGGAAKAAIPKLFTLYTNAAVQIDRTKISTVALMPALKAIDMETARQAEEFLVNSGPLNEARFSYTRTKLTNGLELIAGGIVHTEIPTKTNRCLSKAQLLDSKTGKWTETGEMHTARFDHRATLLPDGKVLVVGGSDIYNNGISSEELYDPLTGTWTVVTNK
jgi:hypothetical protein